MNDADLVDTDLGLTDRGNAHRVARLAKGYLYWAPPVGWLGWTGTHWAELDDSQVIAAWVEPMIDLFRDQVFANGGNKDYLSWAGKSEGAARLNAAMTLVRGLVRADWTDWDGPATDWLLNCANGTVDLKTGKLRAANPADRITHCLPTPYIPEAVDREHDDYPRVWRSFLSWMALEDPELEDWIHRWSGYCTTGATGHQKLAVFFGAGANGKGVYTRALMGVLGPLAVAGGSGLVIKKRDEHQTQLWALRRKRLVVISETEHDGRLDEERVKMLTGEDDVPARAMYKDQAFFRMTAKLNVLTNPKPNVSNDHAIWRRLMMVPCRAVRSEATQDVNMRARLDAERIGILAWLVAGCVRLVAAGLTPPSCMTAATDTYRADMDSFGLWLADSCVTSPTFYEESGPLYRSYRDYIESRGEHPHGMRRWANELAERGFKTRRTPQGARAWGGLRLRMDLDGASSDPF